MELSRRILVLFAHPASQKSRVNRVLVEAVKDLKGVTFHDLYKTYPEFDIDVVKEQNLLLAHDLYIFQHPFFWYSIPAIMKEYLDLVLEHNWAYGSQGKALVGKQVIHAVTTGGREQAYRPDGFNQHTVRDFLLPLEQTAKLCGMHFLPPFVVHGTHQMSETELKNHAESYQQIVSGLRDGTFDMKSLDIRSQINES